MSFQTHTWESRLLSLAQEALQPLIAAKPKIMFDQALLDQAYRHCEDITPGTAVLFTWLHRCCLSPSGRLCGHCMLSAG